jgi:hypothetical protein
MTRQGENLERNADRSSLLSRVRALTEFAQPAPKPLRHSRTGNEGSNFHERRGEDSGSNLCRRFSPCFLLCVQPIIKSQA